MEVSGRLTIIPPFNLADFNDRRQRLVVIKTRPRLVADFRIGSANIYEKIMGVKYPFLAPTSVHTYLKFGKLTSVTASLATKVKKNAHNLRTEVDVVKRTLTLLREIQNNGVSAKSFEESRFSSAEEALSKKLISCGAMTNLTAAALRSLGIPTKCVHGLLFTKDGGSLHSWVEIYFKNFGFAPFDVTSRGFEVREGHIKLATCTDWTDLDFTEMIRAHKNKSFVFEIS